MKNITDYSNPFDALTDFENELVQYTGAAHVVVLDSCTHALELCFRHKIKMGTAPKKVSLPARTYLSVPMVFKQLGITVEYYDYPWLDEYQIGFSDVWDSARRCQQSMYMPGQMQCLSFGRTKPLDLGRGGAILLDDSDAAEWLRRAVNDGRDLSIKPWADQQCFEVGYHYKMLPEEAVHGMNLLSAGTSTKRMFTYPDLRTITIK